MTPDTLMLDTVAAAIQQVPVDSVPLSNIIPEKSGFIFDLVRLFRGMLGMVVLLAIAYVFSNNRKAVNWKMVGTGLLFQLILAIGILYVPFVQVFFEFKKSENIHRGGKSHENVHITDGLILSMGKGPKNTYFGHPISLL